MIINYLALLKFLYKRRSAIYCFYFFLTIALCGCSDKSDQNPEAIKQQKIADEIFESITSQSPVDPHLNLEIANKISIDSIYADLLFDLSYHYYKNRDSLHFRFWNTKSLTYDPSNDIILGEAHWDLGNFFYRENVTDSSYYHFYRAYTLYKKADNEFYAARMLLNMGILQENVKDYIGSEVTTIKAMNIFEREDKKKQLYIAASNLGIVSNGLNQYENAIKYHQEAIQLAEGIGDPELKAISLNNLGVVYENKKEFDSAVYYYKKALEIEELSLDNPKVHAMLLDNIAYSNFKVSPSLRAIDQSKKALELRNKIDHTSGIIINKLHLAEMQKYFGFEDSARNLLFETRSLAQNIKNYDYLLESLKKLSEIDPDNSTAYFENYYALNDSLVRQERSIRNKFARIRYETDEYIEENKMLTQQQILLGGVFVVSMIIALSLYYQKDLRAKNRKLSFEREQQASNEKIYDLILNEQAQMEEARNTERHRISGELHDGVLGKLFGTRLSLSLFGNKHFSNTTEDQEVFRSYVQEMQLIEKEIRSISHDLKKDVVSEYETFIQMTQNLIDKTSQYTEMTISLETDGRIDWERFTNHQLIHIYRILQEGFQNAIKHSRAKELMVRYISMGENLMIEIQDNGCGFKKNNKDGIGLKNMKNRVDQLHGSFKIVSSNAGTKISINIPTQRL